MTLRKKQNKKRTSLYTHTGACSLCACVLVFISCKRDARVVTTRFHNISFSPRGRGSFTSSKRPPEQADDFVITIAVHYDDGEHRDARTTDRAYVSPRYPGPDRDVITSRLEIMTYGSVRVNRRARGIRIRCALYDSRATRACVST